MEEMDKERRAQINRNALQSKGQIIFLLKDGELDWLGVEEDQAKAFTVAAEHIQLRRRMGDDTTVAFMMPGTLIQAKGDPERRLVGPTQIQID